MTIKPRTVSLAVIARDEERSLGRALSSAARLVDELVVLDTGSVDDTVSVALSHGARVEYGTWADDFAAARNQALDACHGDLIFMIDADEWVETDDYEILRRWAAKMDGDHAPETAGLVKVLSATISDGHAVESVASIVRVVPRGCRFVGAVHEQATGYSLLTEVEGLVLRHDGYLPAQAARKKGRNERLLRAALREDPANSYLLFQLGRERQIDDAFAEAAAYYFRALNHLTPAVEWRDDLKARLLYCLAHSNRLDDALVLADRWVRGEDLSAEVLFAIGNLYLDVGLARPREHRRYLALARAAWHACLAAGDPSDGRDHTPGCGGHLAAANIAALDSYSAP